MDNIIPENIEFDLERDEWNDIIDIEPHIQPQKPEEKIQEPEIKKTEIEKPALAPEATQEIPKKSPSIFPIKTSNKKIRATAETLSKILTQEYPEESNDSQTNKAEEEKTNKIRVKKEKKEIEESEEIDAEEGFMKILENPVANPIWLSVSEAAKIGGVTTKTIRRAIQAEKVKYTIHKDRYLVGLRSLIIYLNSSKKLRNKLNFNGLGQYIREWR
jgi:hypothetical protein